MTTRPQGADAEAGGRLGGKRRQGREMALQMLYQMEVGGVSAVSVLRSFDLHGYLAETSPTQQDPNAAFEYASRLVRGTDTRRVEIDERISERADNWRLERMAAVDRNILRLAVYELLEEEETPAIVVVDEAIELAKKFGSEQSGRFINGLLDALLSLRSGGGEAST